MADALETVKALAADYRRWARDAEAENPARSKTHSGRSEALESVAHELEAARKRLRPISNDFGDLSDLPESVLEHLNLAKVDELEQQMRDIVAAADGREIGLDQIIIELYRRHRVEPQSRTFIMNKLYRMGKKGIIEPVEGRKGVYFLPKVSAGWGGNNNKGGFADDLDDDIPF